MSCVLMQVEKCRLQRRFRKEKEGGAYELVAEDKESYRGIKSLTCLIFMRCLTLRKVDGM